MSSDFIGKTIQVAGVFAQFVPGVREAYWAIRGAIVVGSSILGGYIRSRGSADAAAIERGLRVNVASNEAPIRVVYGRRLRGLGDR